MVAHNKSVANCFILALQERQFCEKKLGGQTALIAIDLAEHVVSDVIKISSA